jgi:hypothetical protein
MAMVVVAGCGKEASSASSASTDRGSPKATAAASNGNVDLGSGPYHPAALTGAGSVVGRVVLDSGATPDSIAAAAQGPCAAAPKTIAAAGHPAIVWIADVRSGKRLPIEKRIDLASADCALDPPVQGAVMGSTLNVFNDDRELHRLIFTRLGSHDTLTRMPFYDDGEVVASERVARATGVVEVQCMRHPWMRSYIAVFEHPYFAVTERDGRFKIDSLPPGNYRLMVWQPGLAKPVEQQVEVRTGGEAKAEIRLTR